MGHACKTIIRDSMITITLHGSVKCTWVVLFISLKLALSVTVTLNGRMVVNKSINKNLLNINYSIVELFYFAKNFDAAATAGQKN